MKKVFWIVLLVLLLDQASKIWVKTCFVLGEEVELLSWFRLHFVENNGAAWGIEIGGKLGKLVLTFFRLFAITGIGYWLLSQHTKRSQYIVYRFFFTHFCGCLG